MKFIKDRLARIFAKPGGKEQIKNAYKVELFKCGHPKYSIVDGRVRYWRILKRECYPGGCTNLEGNDYFALNLPQNPLAKPELLVSTEEYENFLKIDLKNFLNWRNRCQHRYFNFMGVLHGVKPRFDVKVRREKNVTFRGFVLIFKECMLGNVFFDDFVYVLIDEKTQYDMNFAKMDTISGTGFFSMDEKGMVVLSQPEKLKIVAKGIEIGEIDRKFLPSMEFRFVDTYIQDICELCPYSLLVKLRRNIVDHTNKTVEKVNSRNFCCTLEACILSEDKVEKATAGVLPQIEAKPKEKKSDTPISLFEDSIGDNDSGEEE